MLNQGTHIDLATRLRTMRRVLDILVPESTSAASEEAGEVALEAVGRRELDESIVLLEEGVQANPFWLRGYLFLATIYGIRAESRVGHHDNRTRAGHVRWRSSSIQCPKRGRNAGADQRTGRA